MEYKKEKDEKALKTLFYSFVGAGLEGRYEEALCFIDDNYAGVGMGEQGIVRSKEDAREVLRDSYIPVEGTVIKFSVQNFIINRVCDDVAILIGEVLIDNIAVNGDKKSSSIMQTVGAKYHDGKWRISFTHASPVVLTMESVEAYPIRFMDNALSILRTDSLAKRDSLTGILNREGFENLATELLEKYNPKLNIALFMIDLDDFKQINDRLGHQTGDIVLQQVAKTLQATFRPYDVVGRIGGDEFMVLMKGDFSASFLEKKAEDLMKTMNLKVDNKKQVPISVSVGVAYGRARTTFEKYYRIADMGLYAAKRAGKSQYHIINADTNSRYSQSASGEQLMSLQSLLDDVDMDEQGKTPYEALVENVPGGVIVFEITKAGLSVNHCNEWFSYFTGYSEDEIVEMQKDKPFIFVHPDDKKAVIRDADEIRHGKDSSNIIYRVRRKDGSYAYINQVITVTERIKGSIIAYGIVTDVEEVIRLKREIEDSQRELETFLGAIPGGVLNIFVTDTLKLYHRNDWSARFLGYTKEELAQSEAKDPLGLVHPSDLPLVNKVLQELIAGKENASFNYRLLDKQGNYRNVRITVTLVEHSNHELIYNGVITDVGEMISIQKELEYTNQKLEMLLSTAKKENKDL